MQTEPVGDALEVVRVGGRTGDLRAELAFDDCSVADGAVFEGHLVSQAYLVEHAERLDAEVEQELSEVALW